MSSNLASIIKNDILYIKQLLNIKDENITETLKKISIIINNYTDIPLKQFLVKNKKRNIMLYEMTFNIIIEDNHVNKISRNVNILNNTKLLNDLLYDYVDYLNEIIKKTDKTIIKVKKTSLKWGFPDEKFTKPITIEIPHIDKLDDLISAISKNEKYETYSYLEPKYQDLISSCWYDNTFYYFNKGKKIIIVDDSFNIDEYPDIPLMHRKNAPKDLMLNGRNYYNIDKIYGISNLKSIYKSDKKYYSLFNSYANQWYDLSFLVCSKLQHPDDFLNFLEHKNNCTYYGSKIANSLIKVASQRIFADPEQSILELPVNSFDSYSTLDGNTKIGKFGLGFFSYLYWLFIYPKSRMEIFSISKQSAYLITIQLRDKNLEFKFVWLNSKSSVKGTHIKLYLPNNTLRIWELYGKFKSQLRKLRYTNRYPLYINKKLINKAKPSYNSCYIDFHVNIDVEHCISIEDFAAGIPISTIFNSVFIPSISTKTIRMSNVIPIDYINDSRIEDSKGKDKGKFTITVGDVAVVDINTNGAYSIIICLPSNTKLPVSRDDIIINNVKDSTEFINGLNIVIKKAVEKKNILTLENALNLYKNYTTSDEIKSIIESLGIKNFVKHPNVMVTQEQYDIIYHKIPFNLYAIISSTSNIYKIEQYLDTFNFSKNNIISNKKVFMIDNCEKTSNGGSLSYLFIDSKINNMDDFVLGYNNEILFLPNNKTLIIEQTNVQRHVKNVNKVYPGHQTLLTTALSRIGAFIKIYYNVENMDYIYSRFTDILILYMKYDKFSIDTYIKYLLFILSNIKIINNYSANKPYFPKIMLRYGFSKNPVISKLEYIMLLDYMLYYNHNNHNFSFPTITDVLRDYSICDYSDIESPYVLYVLLATIYRANKVFKKYDHKILKSSVLKIYPKYVINPEYDNRYHNQYPNNFNGVPTSCYYVIQEVIALMKINITPIIYDKLEIYPSENSYQFNLKTLIEYIFRFPFDPDSDIKNYHNFFKNISIYKPYGINLQIVEIAVNVATTKSFINSVLTELIQNSLDAIRQIKPDDNSIEIDISHTDKEFIMSVTDYVGIPIKSLLALSIPFLSSKTSSNEVTGEMGSGFFNIYRKSNHVKIETFYQGNAIMILDTPIRENNDVVDIKKNILLYHSNKTNKTCISFSVPYTNKFELAEYINQTQIFTANVISLVDFSRIKMNNQDIPKMKKTILLETTSFECYITDNSTESYIFTKGIPFTPLYNYFHDKNIIDNNILEEIKYNIVINIKHGAYTPVHSRSRLNLDILEDLSITLLRLVYYTIVYKLDIYLKNPNIFPRLLTSNYLDYFESSSSVSQLIPILRSKNIYDLKDVHYARTLFESFNGIGKSISTLLTDASNIMKYDPYEKHKLKISQYFNQAITSDPLTKTRLIHILTTWLHNKNYKNSKKMSIYTSEDIKFDIDHLKTITQLLLKPISSFVKHFWIIGREEKLSNFDTYIPTVEFKSIDDSTIAYYTSHKIVINSKKIDKQVALDFINDIKTKDIFYIRNKNAFFASYLSFSIPSSTLIHELEHARRQQTHNSGLHDSIIIKFPKQIDKIYDFNDGASEVLNYLTLKGLYTKWLADI